jgi:hypothetical protein
MSDGTSFGMVGQGMPEGHALLFTQSVENLMNVFFNPA